MRVHWQGLRHTTWGWPYRTFPGVTIPLGVLLIWLGAGRYRRAHAHLGPGESDG